MRDVVDGYAEGAAQEAAGAGPVPTEQNGDPVALSSQQRTPLPTKNTSAIDAAAVLNSPPAVEHNLPSDLATLQLQREALQRQAAVFESQARPLLSPQTPSRGFTSAACADAPSACLRSRL